jgi:hypothetical protein
MIAVAPKRAHVRYGWQLGVARQSSWSVRALMTLIVTVWDHDPFRSRTALPLSCRAGARLRRSRMVQSRLQTLAFEAWSKLVEDRSETPLDTIAIRAPAADNDFKLRWRRSTAQRRGQTKHAGL